MAVDQHDPRVQEYLRQEEEEKAKKKQKPKPAPKPFKKAPVTEDSGKKQRRLFKKTRAGVTLTRDEVRAIKAGRKRLRKELRERGLKKRSDLEVTAASLGLYFDKRHGALLAWLLSHWLAGLLGVLATLLLTILLFSTVTRARGYFTINLTDGMFREGFILSETIDFANATTQLFAVPAEDVPCISISHLPTNVDEIDGQHNDTYFAYTWYLRNEGESTVDYNWELSFTADDLEVSHGLWIAVFEDGVMRLYARASGKTGEEEALPAFDDPHRGYRFLPIRELAPDSDQFQVVVKKGGATWWRVVPDKFISDVIITDGEQFDVKPGDVHKYTVVMWIEGDDPDATDDLIGGHAGVTMQYWMSSETEANTGQVTVRWDDLWDDLRFWLD